MEDKIKLRARIHIYDNGCWAFGLSLVHIPEETGLSIKLFKLEIFIGMCGLSMGYWI